MDANPFTQVEVFFTKAEPVSAFADEANTFMLARVLSMGKSGFYAATQMNRYGNGLPKWAVAGVGYALTPKQNPPRTAYIKKPKPPYTEKELRIVDCIQQELHCSPYHAQNTYDMLKKHKFDFERHYGQKLMK